MSELIGKQLGPYKIQDRVGGGGMATVYSAFHNATNRTVAVKVMLPTIRSDELFSKRFEREAQLLAGLQHIHIVPVFDYGEQDDITYLVMPLLPGKTLEDVINEQSLDLKQVVAILHQLASALDYAHSRKLLHRDIKPSNVMLDESGHALLADFGLTHLLDSDLSKLTADSVIIGTPSYMSPEQGQGQALTTASDIYSLGVVLYEMLTGEIPFQAETPISVIFKHVTEAPPVDLLEARQLSPYIIDVVLKALAKNPEDRFVTATALAEAFEDAVMGKEAQQSTQVNQNVETRLAHSPDVSEESAHPDAATTADVRQPQSLNSLKGKRKGTPTASQRRVLALVGVVVAMLAGLVVLASGAFFSGAAHDAFLFQIAAHDGAVNSLAYGADNGRLLSGGADDNAFVWLTDTQELDVTIEGHTADVLTVAFHPSDNLAITGGRDSMSYTWNTENGEKLITNFEGNAIREVVYSPQGNYNAYVTGATISWGDSDPGAGAMFYLSDLTENIFRSLAISPDEMLVAAGDEAGTIRLLDRGTGAVLQEMAIRDTIVLDLAFHPDGERLAAATDDGNVTIWRTDGSLAATWAAEAGTANVLGYAPSGRVLAAGYEDGTVRLWQINTDEMIEVFTGHASPVLSLAFNADGARLATGDEDGQIIIWRVPEI